MRTYNAVAAAFLLTCASNSEPAFAQPLPEVVPVPIITPFMIAPANNGSPDWEDRNRHIRIIATYDGRSIEVLSAASGDGSARPYLSQRRDIVVLVLDEAKNVLREFNLPDPLELRVLERPQALSSVIELSGIVEMMPRTEGRIGRSAVRFPSHKAGIAQQTESVVHQKSTQFELFVPRLDRANWLEFHAGDARGRLLGRVDLAKIP